MKKVKELECGHDGKTTEIIVIYKGALSSFLGHKGKGVGANYIKRVFLANKEDGLCIV